MKKVLPTLIFLLCIAMTAFSQSYDYETEANSVTFRYFGSSLDGQNAMVIENPNPTGVNESTKVLEYMKAAGSMIWAGAFADPLPTPMDVTVGGQICVDVHFDHIGNLAVKLENSTNGFSNWITTQENTVVGEWQTLCYDLDANGLEDAMTPATGGIFGGLAIFVDFQMSDPDNTVTTYIDNIRYVPPVTCNTIFDFEEDGLSSAYQYFGSSLEGQQAEIIDNPNPTGINMSAKVTAYVKAAEAMTWAGAFALDQPTVDATNGGEICVDVHMDHIGVFGLKLEQATDGASNWIQTVANTKINEWEQLCIDLDLNGLEDAMTPASGHIFGQLVVFPDFGIMGTDVDVTYYFDNLCITGPPAPSSYDVTFAVDMNNYAGTYTSVFLSGTFNNWSPDANPMSDDDGDGIFTVDMELAGDGYEYKFQVDGWTDSEQFLQSDECTVTFIDDQGQVFTNRSVLIDEDGIQGPFCWGSCYACGQESTVTWNLNMNQEDVSDLGVYVAGGVFGHAELPAMTDDDGDGIFTFTLRRQVGFESDYTFLNGICLPDWECKEMIAGQDCAVDPFNDRHLGPIDGEMVINTCFGECTETTECTGGPQKYIATFHVDMSQTTVAPEGVFLSGGLINNWSPDANPMTDDDGDLVYTTTVELIPGDIEFKFVNGSMYENIGLGDCTIEAGEFINRFFTMPEMDTTLASYLWESCDVVVNNKETFVEDFFTVQPNVVDNIAWISCIVSEEKAVNIYDLNGKLIQTYNMTKNQFDLEIDLSNVSAGMYVISLTTNENISTQRIVVR